MKLARPGQELAPGDERLHDQVAQVGVVVEQLAQGVGRHLVGLAVGAGDGADDGRPAGHLRHVAGELAGAVDRDGLRLVAGFVHDLDLARLDDEEAGVAVAGREELFPGVERPELRQVSSGPARPAGLR